MRDHKGNIRGYHWLSKAWYAKANLATADYIDEIMIGFYAKEGGTSGEFGVRWYQLGDNRPPAMQLQVFEDALHAFWECKDLLERLAEKDGEYIQPKQLKKLLNELGFEDLTEYKR